ncbi:unnamed protein product [Pedinophyceae sp. YPF-701]|nr:unnamed protein product [Pedinophyceae sp. YPF-701]
MFRRSPLLRALIAAILTVALSRTLSVMAAGNGDRGADVASTPAKNVLGTQLQACGFDPVTGFYRDGFCHTGPTDTGRHVVAAVCTQEFLEFTASRGNPLNRPAPAYGFPGLKPGDRWCLCALRWKEAYDAGVAPPVDLAATHEGALRYVTMEQLQEHALQPNAGGDL